MIIEGFVMVIPASYSKHLVSSWEKKLKSLERMLNKPPFIPLFHLSILPLPTLHMGALYLD